MLSAIPNIPLVVGANRVVHGVRVEHVCGNPLLSHDDDRRLQRRIVEAALKALQTAVDGPTQFEPEEMAREKEAASA